MGDSSSERSPGGVPARNAARGLGGTGSESGPRVLAIAKLEPLIKESLIQSLNLVSFGTHSFVLIFSRISQVHMLCHNTQSFSLKETDEKLVTYVSDGTWFISLFY